MVLGRQVMAASDQAAFHLLSGGDSGGDGSLGPPPPRLNVGVVGGTFAAGAGGRVDRWKFPAVVAAGLQRVFPNSAVRARFLSKCWLFKKFLQLLEGVPLISALQPLMWHFIPLFPLAFTENATLGELGRRRVAPLARVAHGGALPRRHDRGPRAGLRRAPPHRRHHHRRQQQQQQRRRRQ